MTTPLSLLIIALGCLPMTLAAAAVDEEGYPMGKAGWGAFAIPAPLSTQAEHDLLPGEGVLVVHVRPNGTADTLGINLGDVILSINATPIASRRDIRNLMTTVTPGDQARVSVARTGGSNATLNGVFKERTPRPPGAPPWAGFRPPGDGRQPAGFAPEDPDAAIDRQFEELLTERAALAAARADLTAAQAAAAQSGAITGAWYMRVDIDHHMTPGTAAAPLSSETMP